MIRIPRPVAGIILGNLNVRLARQGVFERGPASIAMVVVTLTVLAISTNLQIPSHQGTSHVMLMMLHGHPRHPQSHQPTTTSQPAQPYYPATIDRVTSTVARGMRDPIHGKHAYSKSFLRIGYSLMKTALTNYWEGDRSGPSVSTVYMVNA